MTKEQEKQLEEYIRLRIDILKDLKKKQYNNEWTDEFNELVIEVRQKLKNNVESLWVSPIYDGLFFNIEPTDEQRKLSGKIRKQINNQFKMFVEESGVKDRYPY